MPIDLFAEHVVTLKEAAKLLPEIRRGRRVSRSTLYRWMNGEAGGTRLESARLVEPLQDRKLAPRGLAGRGRVEPLLDKGLDVAGTGPAGDRRGYCKSQHQDGHLAGRSGPAMLGHE